MRRALLVLSLVVFTSMWTPARAATSDVSIEDFRFNPSTITVNENDTVAWHNNGKTGHTVTADDGSFDSSPDCPANPNACLQPRATFTVAFQSPGSFSYHCKIHSSMTGTVVVTPNPATSTTPTTQAPTTTASTTTSTSTSTSTTTTSSTTTTASTTSTTSTTTTSTTAPSSSSAAPVTVNDGDSGSSSAPWLILGALLVGGLAALAYWLWWRSGQPDNPPPGPSAGGEPPPTTQGPSI